MIFFKRSLVFNTILLAFSDLSFTIDIFFRNLLFQNFLLGVSKLLRFRAVFTLLIISFFFLVSNILKFITFFNKNLSTFFLSFLLFHRGVKLSCKKFLQISKLLDESTHFLRLMLIHPKFSLVDWLTKQPNQLSNVLFHVQSTLSGFRKAQFRIQWCHVNSIFNAHIYKLLFKISLS